MKGMDWPTAMTIVMVLVILGVTALAIYKSDQEWCPIAPHAERCP